MEGEMYGGVQKHEKALYCSSVLEHQYWIFSEPVVLD